MKYRPVRMEDGTWAFAVDCLCCGKTIFLTQPDVIATEGGASTIDVLTPMSAHLAND